jgi:signal transduction histidine kinase
MLESRQLPPERTEHAIAAIGRSASALAHLIDDLLDTSRILKGGVRLALQPVDLVAITQGALDAVRPLATTRNVHLAFDAVAVASTRAVIGDAVRLQQVFWNLLANAIKFTPEGGRVDVFIDSANDHMEVRVVDTGCGISPDFLPHVFERFRQAEDATTQRHTGLGLGLGIVRSLVELHGGTVHAASPGVGHGATFTVRLPMAAGSAPAAGGRAGRAPSRCVDDLPAPRLPRRDEREPDPAASPSRSGRGAPRG